MSSELGALSNRLERLERDNRRLKRLGTAILLLASTLLLMGQGRPNRTVEAERFIVRDRQGRVRVEIGTPRFSGAAVGLNSDDPAIWISDEKGQDRAVLTIDGLWFADVKGRKAANLEVESGKRAGLAFYDKDGKVLWSAP